MWKLNSSKARAWKGSSLSRLCIALSLLFYHRAKYDKKSLLKGLKCIERVLVKYHPTLFSCLSVSKILNSFFLIIFSIIRQQNEGQNEDQAEEQNNTNGDPREHEWHDWKHQR